MPLAPTHSPACNIFSSRSKAPTHPTTHPNPTKTISRELTTPLAPTPAKAPLVIYSAPVPKPQPTPQPHPNPTKTILLDARPRCTPKGSGSLKRFHFVSPPPKPPQRSPLPLRTSPRPSQDRLLSMTAPQAPGHNQPRHRAAVCRPPLATPRRALQCRRAARLEVGASANPDARRSRQSQAPLRAQPHLPRGFPG